MQPWITSSEKISGMCSRDCSAARWAWLMFLTPARSSTDPIVPAAAAASSFGPGVALAPSGPATLEQLRGLRARLAAIAAAPVDSRPL